MIALRTGRFAASALEIVTAILATMPNRQHLDKQLRAFGHGAASGFRKGGLQAMGIEYPASTNGKVKSKYSAGSVSVCSLIDDGQNTIDYFAFVHAPPRGRKSCNWGYSEEITKGRCVRPHHSGADEFLIHPGVEKVQLGISHLV